MTGSSRDRARTLELLIRAAVAEERLLGVRLARMADSQRRAREDVVERERLRRSHRPPGEAGETAAG
jgi:hypothetical protein